jgi:DNA-binding SARP family transcriptional activator
VFWDGAEHENPRRCLNTALWRLNRVLGEPAPGAQPYLYVDAQRIGFNTASDCWLDVAEFERCCQLAEQVPATSPEEQAALYQQAVSLYTADLLVDCYEEWALIERQRLQRMYLDALDRLVTYHSMHAEYGPAIGFGLKLLGSDPLREDVHRTVMQLHLAAGRPGAALRHYQECDALLRRELGTLPAPETQAVVREIFCHRQRSEPPPAARRREDLSGEAVVEAPPGSPAEALADALGRLHTAISFFDSAQAELRDAAISVERLAQRAAGAPSAPNTYGARQHEHALRSAALLMTQSATDLNRVAGRFAARV